MGGRIITVRDAQALIPGSWEGVKHTWRKGFGSMMENQKLEMGDWNGLSGCAQSDQRGIPKGKKRAGSAELEKIGGGKQI